MTNNNKIINLNAKSAILAGCLISAFGATLFNILPLFLGSVQDSLGFDDQQLGLITSAYFTGFTLSTISAYFWVRKFDWRKVSVMLALATLLVCGLLIVASSYTAYLALLVLLGASTSAIYAIGTTYLGDTDNPARSYGFKIGTEAGLGALLLFLLPPFVVAQWGLQGLLYSMLGVFAVLALSIVWLPAKGIKDSEAVSHIEGQSGVPLLPIVLSLIAFFIFFAGISALWAFIERIGNDYGFAGEDVGLALSASLVVAMGGSFLAAALGDRFGFFKPVLAALVVTVVAMLALNRTEFIYYFAGASLFALAYGFALPMQVTIVSCFDTKGEYVVLTAVAIALGGIVGPAVAGFLKSPDSNSSILILTVVAVAVSVAIYGFVFHYARQHHLKDQQNLQPSESPF
ncbi:MAG: MFS transporter [Amphritea sp.]